MHFIHFFSFFIVEARVKVYTDNFFEAFTGSWFDEFVSATNYIDYASKLPAIKDLEIGVPQGTKPQSMQGQAK